MTCVYVLDSNIQKLKVEGHAHSTLSHPQLYKIEVYTFDPYGIPRAYERGSACTSVQGSESK